SVFLLHSTLCSLFLSLCSLLSSDTDPISLLMPSISRYRSNQSLNAEYQPIPIQSESLNAEYQPIPIQSESLNAEYQPIPIQSESPNAEYEPIPIQSESLNAEYEPIPIQSESLNAEPVHNVQSEETGTH
uniref:Uncharacterized protein n=1 Tax=Astyanax mexicanus TaxID=7994 RepID=A0A3B1JZG6_ASTMX